MNTDGRFTLKHVKVKGKIGSPITFVPFGDVHWDSPAHSEDEWNKFLTWAKAQKDVLFLGMGDMFDSFSGSERMVMADERLHESTRKREEQIQRGRVAQFAKQIEFMRGKLIGLMGGNHFMAFPDGTTSDMVLCNKLGCSYLGVCTAIKLTIDLPSDKRVGMDIFAHHGRGSGMTAGGRMNSVEKLAQVCDADIYLMGDNHARGALPLGDRLAIGHGSEGVYLRSRRRWIARTGSFLRAYVPGEQNYVVARALPPASLGWVYFTITPTRSREGGEDRIGLDITGTQ